jgi:hypothetical protein
MKPKKKELPYTIPFRADPCVALTFVAYLGVIGCYGVAWCFGYRK